MLLDYYLENDINFTTLKNISSINIFKELFTGCTVPTPEELSTSIIKYKSDLIILTNQQFRYKNLILAFTQVIDEQVIAVSFAVTTDNQKIFLLLHSFDISDFQNSLLRFCRQSVIKVFENYRKKINFIVYESQNDEFIQFQNQLSKTVDNTSFDVIFFCTPSYTSLVTHLKSLSNLIDDEDDKASYTVRVTKLEKIISSLNLNEGLEEILKLMSEFLPVQFLEKTDKFFMYCNPIALAANFLNPVNRGKLFVHNIDLYNQMIEVITNLLDEDPFDYFSKYVSKLEMFRIPYGTSMDKDTVKYWRKVKVTADATEALQVFCTFACDLLNISCGLKTNLDYDKCIHYKKNSLAKDYFHIFMTYVMEYTEFS